MKTRTLFFAMIMLLGIGSFAQESEKKFAFELNGGLSLATQKLNETDLNPGFGFEGIFHYRFMKNLGVYGGWGWNRFGADNSFAGNDICFEETGYILGLNFKNQISDSRLSYYLRAGALYNHIETENSDGDIVNDTKHGWGYQAAGGLEFDLGKNWNLLTGLKFNSLSRTTNYNATNLEFDYQYVSLRIGIKKNF